MIQTPTTRLVFRSATTCGSPTTTMLESRVAMKIPTVVTVRTTHLYSKRTDDTTSSIFSKRPETRNIKSGRRNLKSRHVPRQKQNSPQIAFEICTPPHSHRCQASQEVSADLWNVR